MKNWLIGCFASFFFIQTSFALDASVSLCSFKSPAQNYVEVYFHIVGKTMNFQTVGADLKQAGVNVIILFKQNGEIVKFDKFNLQSPAAIIEKDFIDLKRYALQNGKYQVEVSLTDLNLETNSKNFVMDFEVRYDEEALYQSDIQLLVGFSKSEDENNPFVKNGIRVEPLPFNWYHKNTSQLIFYHEIYNADKVIADAYFLSFYIKKEGNQETEKPVLISHKRQDAQPINPVLHSMDISALPSGNYVLTIEVRNREKELLSQKSISFQRSNPYLSMDSSLVQDSILSQEFVAALSPEEVEYSLRAIAPKVSEDGEVLNLLIAEKNLQAQKMYLFGYWVKVNPNFPEIAYKKYMEVARAVDRLFKSGFGHGFETDRGYVYLKYGRPDDMISVEDEASAPPYEIWSYNHFPATNQNNVRFLFYNPSLSPGNYQLLHSTARGETNNPQWQLDLYRDAPTEIDGSNFIDATQVQDNFGRRAARYFNDY